MASKKKEKIDINDLLANENIIETEITETLYDNTLNYALSVITDRALPDVKDGLKPVQRRILWAAYAKGIMPDSNFVKCAQVAGEVMGKYHPHGCVAYNTRLMLSDYSIVRIGDLFNTNKKELEVFCVDDTGNVVLSKMNHIRIGKCTNEIYHIILSNDTDIQVTDNHPFLLNNLQWKRADELKINDELFGYTKYLCSEQNQLNHMLNVPEKYNQKIMVKDIRIEKVHNVPMYDFTVDTYENALFLTNSETNNDIIFYNMICLHNSSYGTMANMSQPWTFRYPLMDFHGNNGDMDGYPPSAERYTETRLHKNALALLDGVNEHAIEFRPNYDETTEEPVYLPGLLPNLLVNGAYGIAVGYTTKFPSHNLTEVIDGIIATIKNPNIDLEELMEYIKGPDFPLGSYLVNNENIKSLYENGMGKLTFKAKYHIEENKENQNQQIVFTELPPDCNKPKLMQTLYKLCIENKEIARVVDVRDETSGTSNVRIVVELHKTGIVNMTLNDLFKKTNLQQDINYIMRCVDDNQPRLLSLVDIVKIYIDFHTQCYINKFKYLIEKQSKKLHIQEGYQKILINLDEAIDMIKNALNDKLLKQDLMTRFELDEEQVNVVLEMKLRNLTKLSSNDVNKCIKQLNTDIQHYNDLLNDKALFNQNFINDLNKLKQQLGDERRTELIAETHIQEQEVEEEYVLCLTNTSKIKYYTKDDFNNLTKYKERQDMIIKHIDYNTKNNVLLVLEDGNYICLGFNYILGDITKLTNKAKIVDIIEIESNINKKLFIMTNKGTISKINLDKIKLKKLYPLVQLQDEVIIKSVLVEDTSDEVFTVVTTDGKIARHYVKSFSAFNPNNKGLKLTYDNVADFSVNDGNYIICVDDKNYICKFNTKDFLIKGRISKPITACKSDNITHIYIVNDFNYITNKGEKQKFDINKIKINNKGTKCINYNLDINYIKE